MTMPPSGSQTDNAISRFDVYDINGVYTQRLIYQRYKLLVHIYSSDIDMNGYDSYSNGMCGPLKCNKCLMNVNIKAVL